jgi:hypothetical protein
MEEILDVVQHHSQLDNDIQFFYHVDQTIQGLEKMLTRQRRVSSNIFNRLIQQNFDIEISNVIEQFRKKQLPLPSSTPEVIRQESSLRSTPIPITSPPYNPNTPIPSQESSLESFRTPTPELPPLGSIQNPIPIEEDLEIQEKSSTPKLRRSTRARKIVRRIVGNLKGR